MTAKRLLILGGTGEARRLTARLRDHFGLGIELIYSIAGRTGHPNLPDRVTLRRGGFGGISGLRYYLESERITALLDATHPFAAQMADHAARAARDVAVPSAKFRRAEWTAQSGDRWIWVADTGTAVRRLPELGSRALLTLGADAVAAFYPVARHVVAARLITPPTAAPFPILTDVGPFTPDQERDLFDRWGVDLLVTKASGGSATAAKLTVARERGLPVLMIARPAWPDGVHPINAQTAVDWATAVLDPK